MNIHIRKINFASTRNSGSPFWAPSSDLHFSQKVLETIYPKVNVHRQQSGLNMAVICLRRADNRIQATFIVKFRLHCESSQEHTSNHTKILRNSSRHCLMNEQSRLYSFLIRLVSNSLVSNSPNLNFTWISHDFFKKKSENMFLVFFGFFWMKLDIFDPRI